VKKWLIAAAAAALAFAPGRLEATQLKPGFQVTPDGLAYMPKGSLFGPVQSVAFSGAGYSGTLYYAAYKQSSNGHLDFLYQVQLNTTSTDKVRNVFNTDFHGVGTNVSYLTSVRVTTALGFQTPSTDAAATAALFPTGAGRSANGSKITWSFDANPIGAGQVSAVFFVKTNGQAVGLGTTVLKDHSKSNPVTTYAPVPVPEPSTLVLASGCLLGLGLYRRVKRSTDS
jgi:hypothetical protein